MKRIRAKDAYYGTFAGRWVSKALELSGLSRSELAEKAAISGSHLSRIINGRVDPSCATVLRLVESCGCEIIELRVKLPKVAQAETAPLQSA